MAEEETRSVSGTVAIGASAGMAIFYVAILYSPTVLLRLPPPTSINSFMIRRFVCASISSAVSVIVSSAILGIRSFKDTSSGLRVIGIRGDHMWQALVFPLLLTSLPYAGSFLSKILLFAREWRETCEDGENASFQFRNLVRRILLLTTNVLAWRAFVVAPITEEFVFRACMVPLLLCSGFRRYIIIFLCPAFFSLAHLNNFLELYYQKGYGFYRAAKVAGIQLGYTMMFGWYAAFLFMRTGNLLSPIVAHIFCNSMGLPALPSSPSKVATGLTSLAGVVCFFFLLFPASNPKLYNDLTEHCRCWHGYCNWN